MSAHTEAATPPEFSRPFEVAELEDGELVREITADEGELAALQRRFAIEALHGVSAKLTIAAAGEGVVQVSGTVRAKLSQICIVTLDPVDEEVAETIAVTYLPPGVEEPHGGLEGDLEAPDEYEAFDGVSIDLGELTAQQIAAAINPYPRKDGVIFGNQGQLGDNDPEERDNPFAVLEALKAKDGQTQDR